ncbi:MAG: hypothetical protein JW969_12275 [Spirochaetales bacterium]|nr:hypothetical protein [Spirochaetales bacterium]
MFRDKSILGAICIWHDITDIKQRLSDISTPAATVAHELQNPLGVIQAAIYNTRRKNSNRELDKHLNKIDKKIIESEQTINNLLGYSRIKVPKLMKTNIYDFIDECITNFRTQHRESNIKMVCDYGVLKEVGIKIDPFQIRAMHTSPSWMKTESFRFQGKCKRMDAFQSK